jgi:tripartite ATP-independent transporter DctP family solute receptor
VNERLAGRASVTVFGSSQLGTDEIMLQKLKLQTLDLTVPSTIMSSFVPAFGLFEMPYLVDDREHMKRIGEAIFWPEVAPLAEAQGYKILALWENGFRHITNNVRPITVPQDLAGIRLRTPRGDWRVRLFRVFGANPTPMPLSEVFVGLQQGTIDGQENPIAQVTSLRLQEVQRYLSLTGHVYTPAYLATGARKFDSLPSDVQAILAQAAKDTQAYVYQQAAKLDDELLGKIKAAGVKVNEADKDAFIAASKDVYQEFGKEVPDGGKLVDKAIELGKGM